MILWCYDDFINTIKNSITKSTPGAKIFSDVRSNWRKAVCNNILKVRVIGIDEMDCNINVKELLTAVP